MRKCILGYEFYSGKMTCLCTVCRVLTRGARVCRRRGRSADAGRDARLPARARSRARATRPALTHVSPAPPHPHPHPHPRPSPTTSTPTILLSPGFEYHALLHAAFSTTTALYWSGYATFSYFYVVFLRHQLAYCL